VNHWRFLQLQRLFFAASIGVALFFGGIVSNWAAELKFLRGHVPPAVKHLAPIGRLSSERRLDLAIGLPLRNKEALTNLLEQVSDPASPNFRHYLTSQQFTENFGPSEKDYQSVIDFAKTNGLTVTVRHPNRMLLDVNGPVANIEKAFHLILRVYQHPKENRTFFAPDLEPSVDSILPVLDVSGLDNFSLPHPKVRISPSDNSTGATPKAGSGSGGTYLGNDFRAAYVPSVSLDGTGQTVALVQFDGYYLNDITRYASLAGLPDVTLTNVLLDGFNGTPTTFGNIEVSLDIEMVMSMATNVSQIILYEGNLNNFIPNDVLNRIATDNAASEISCSWGWSGGPNATTAQIFQQMILNGQSFFNASGDDDAFTNGAVDNPSNDGSPSSSPYITQVGGVTLTTSGPTGSWISETVWNRGNGTGSSGGISSSNAIPSWQTNIDMTANQGSTTLRNIPDVALTAENVFVAYGNGNSATVGGTSCAAPLWAGFIALVNQQAQLTGHAPVGFINPAIYAIGQGANYTADFHDIVTGNNFSTSSPTHFPAVAGYDLCTGWGTPNGANLINDLATPDGFGILPGTGFVASGAVGGSFNVTAENFSLTNSGASSLDWSLANTSLWLEASSSGGTLSPGDSAAVTVSLNSTANQMAAGVYDSTIWFTNLTDGFTQSRQFTLLIGQSVVQNGGFESGDFSAWMLNGDTAGFNLVVNGSAFAGLTPHSGTYLAALGESGFLAYLSQSVPTVAGQAYLLSLWLDSPNLKKQTLTPNEFSVIWNGTTLFDQTNIGKIGWTNLQFIVTATNSSSTLQFGARDDNYYLGLDDVSVTPVALPAFQTLTQTDNSFAFTWSATTGLVYQVQYKTNLLQPDWIDLGDAINATNVLFTTSDTNAILNSPQRFYRIQLLP
jgi:hypothetical protein